MNAPLPNPVANAALIGGSPPAPQRKARRKALFFDRVKLLVIIAVILGFLVAKRRADYPIVRSLTR